MTPAHTLLQRHDDGIREGSARIVLPGSGRPTATDLAVEHVKRLIWEGRLTPGDRVPQAEIAVDLGMSATPVREAMAVLSQQGRVNIENHRGTFVGPFDRQYLLEHYELMGIVIGWSAKRSVGHINEQSTALLAEMAAIIRETDLPELLWDAGTTILELVTTAGSGVAKNVTKCLVGVVPGNVFLAVPASIELTKRIVPDVVDAVISGAGDLASALYQEMYRNQGRLVVDQLIANGVFSEG